MKTGFIFSMLSFVLCSLFLAGCSVPGLEKAASQTGEGMSRVIRQELVYDHRMTYNSYYDWDPSIVWNDDDQEYGLVWKSHHDVYFARIDKYGFKIGEDILIYEGGTTTAGYPDIVWTGSGYGIVWCVRLNGRDSVYFAKLNKNGSKIINDKIIADDDSHTLQPDIVWTGSQYGVAWSNNLNIYFTRLNSSGTTQSTRRISTTESGGKYNPEVVWTGNEYGVVWGDGAQNNNVYFIRVNSTGMKIGSDLWIDKDTDTDYGEYPSIAWNNIANKYGVVWQGNEPGSSISEIFFTIINSSGEKENVHSMISDDDNYDSEEPSLSWTGSEFGVAWTDGRNGDDEIYFARISSSGSKIGYDTRISYDNNSDSDSPCLTASAWSGTAYAVVWRDYRHSQYEIYLGRINYRGSRIPYTRLKGTLSGSIHDYYYIRNRNSGKYLTHQSGGGLCLKPFYSSYEHTQEWKFAESSGYPGYYKIISKWGRRIKGHLPGSTDLTLETGGGGSLVLWRLYDRENDCYYLLRSKYNLSYRIYPSGSLVKLLTSSGSNKLWEIILGPEYER